MKISSLITAAVYIALVGVIVTGLFLNLLQGDSRQVQASSMQPTTLPTQSPTQTPQPTQAQSQKTPTPTIVTHNPVVTGIVKTMSRELATNTNPITDGIKQSFGATNVKTDMALPQTADDNDTDEKFPSGNKIVDESILSIPKLNLVKQIYRGAQMGTMLTVGDNEVLQADSAPHMLYGHNSKTVFGSLHALTFGDTVIVTEKNSTQTFKISYIQYLSDQAPTPQAQAGTIHLVTCDHTDPHVRLIMTAVRI